MTHFRWSVFAVLLLTGCQKTEFASAEGKFKVQIPGSPKEDSPKEESRKTPDGAVMKMFVWDVRTPRFTVRKPLGFCTVGFADMVIPNEPGNKMEARLNAARDDMLKSAGATERDPELKAMIDELGKKSGKKEQQAPKVDVAWAAKSEANITLNDKHPGREIRGKLGHRAVHARIYFVDQRLYEIMVIGIESWVESPEAAKFLDSLVVTP